jgi:hypothetical protein
MDLAQAASRFMLQTALFRSLHTFHADGMASDITGPPVERFYLPRGASAGFSLANGRHS